MEGFDFARYENLRWFEKKKKNNFENVKFW
jgi:hypothetical protein